jgi:hypothetical protein
MAVPSDWRANERDPSSPRHDRHRQRHDRVDPVHGFALGEPAIVERVVLGDARTWRR